MAGTMLIAEIDEVGDVIWVWQADHASGVARPLTRDAAPALDLSGIEVYGASFEAIAAWIRRAAASAYGARGDAGA